MTDAQILDEVRALLIEIIGEEYALGLDIGMDTSFETDLELESIEFVTLATRLGERYGERVDFVGFLAAKDLDEIIGLTVGAVVRHVAHRQTPAGAVDG
ncbi:MAG: acyl carrier protein [Pseudonocardiaceae bacterium]